MPKYHISSDGNPRVCTASEGNCPIGGDETHYTSKEAARSAFEAAVEASDSSSKKVQSSESVRTVTAWGTVEWRNPKGQLHRDGDLPAVEAKDGSKYWYQNGEHHREGGPAVELESGTKGWYQNGKLHRDGGLPAIEFPDGTKEWYQNGRYHRDGGLPAIEKPNGEKWWWINGIFQYRISSDGNRKDSY